MEFFNKLFGKKKSTGYEKPVEEKNEALDNSADSPTKLDPLRVKQLVDALEASPPKSQQDVLDITSFLRDYTITELISACVALLHKDNSELRIRGIKLLGSMGTKAKVAMPYLITEQGQRDSMEAFELSLAILKIVPVENVEQLLEQISDKDWVERQAAIWYIFMTPSNGPDTLPTLIQLAARDPSPHVRHAAVATLGKIGGNSAKPEKPSKPRWRMNRQECGLLLKWLMRWYKRVPIKALVRTQTTLRFVCAAQLGR
ncbi:MAG: HEAT repeat domain-containing protein [Candidatus Thiodiazotropha sp. (ex Lucinoma borealis)]|nr:HEAT repeat domain-containing protein [Candidatus Thiodiazotropha sp. (ex Lucinoma borealis)]